MRTKASKKNGSNPVTSLSIITPETFINRIDQMNRPLKAIAFALLAATALSLPKAIYAQGILDGLRGQLQRELRNAAQDLRIPSNMQPPLPQQPPPQQPKIGSNSVPSETPGQNIERGFRPDNSFFQPQPQPQPLPGQNPTQTYYPPTQQTFPPSSNQLPPSQQTLQYFPPGSGTNSGNIIRSSPSMNYAEPPRKQQTFNNETIVIRCPKEAPRSIRYKLVVGSSSYEYTMEPGQSQTFTENKIWNIRFNRGSLETTYRLRGGQEYAFETEGNGGVQLYDVTHIFPDPPQHPR